MKRRTFPLARREETSLGIACDKHHAPFLLLSPMVPTVGSEMVVNKKNRAAIRPTNYVYILIYTHSTPCALKDSNASDSIFRKSAHDDPPFYTPPGAMLVGFWFPYIIDFRDPLIPHTGVRYLLLLKIYKAAARTRMSQSERKELNWVVTNLWRERACLPAS